MTALAPLVRQGTPSLVIGAVLALVYLALLRWNVRLYLGTRGVWQPVAVHVARLGAVGAVFWSLALRGPVPLLAALAGFVVVRGLAVRAAGVAAGGRG
jgi:F1F0 ATPase subunit 2